ncbi:MAG: hypothetical protein AMJ53_14910 [Gammaproteobacteria bacterium SG8_11]|nr:MAG: hypothetical protein AMJ53_14910 [Gammaproteobacteria bacterium SG8_11]
MTAVAYAEPEAESEETVSLEFLEFLGEFQTEDGEWIDPVNLLEMEQSQSKRNDEEQTDE